AGGRRRRVPRRPARGGARRPRARAPPPAGVPDTTAAAHAFAAAVLYGRLSGEPPERCARYGAIAGAYACTVPAARADAIGRDALLRQAAEPSR
ncbi:PfkB family carbohydrate kinase, partial [Streptomyces tricolor]